MIELFLHEALTSRSWGRPKDFARIGGSVLDIVVAAEVII